MARARRSRTDTSARRKERGVSRRWSAQVTKHSNALDLDRAIFTADDPKRIARSLKRSARASTRRKGTPYQSAMSMLNFYINRGGKNLSARRRLILERTKRALRAEFGREQVPAHAPARSSRV